MARDQPRLNAKSLSMDNPLSGIVLAGGRSLRMGRNKAGLPFGGKSLICWVVHRIASICREVFIVAQNAADYRDCGATVVVDRWPGAGPLGGLATGLEFVVTPHAAVVACDLPFVEAALLAGLAGRAGSEWDAVVPTVGGSAQPLCAIYTRGAGQTAAALMQKGGRSLHELLATPKLRVCYVAEDTLRAWDPALRSFENINTPEDYERAKAHLAESAPDARRH
jgi:molybdopterin-guanine dinucleotide biosynthesis protein A